jgi:hypothetical protein
MFESKFKEPGSKLLPVQVHIITIILSRSRINVIKIGPASGSACYLGFTGDKVFTGR